MILVTEIVNVTIKKFLMLLLCEHFRCSVYMILWRKLSAPTVEMSCLGCAIRW